MLNKKILSVVMSCGMVIAAMTGCNSKTAEVTPEPTSSPEQAAVVEFLSTARQNATLLKEEANRSMFYPTEEVRGKKILLVRCDGSEEDRQAVALAKQISDKIQEETDKVKTTFGKIDDDNLKEFMAEEEKIFDEFGTVYLNVIVSSGFENRLDAAEELGLFDWINLDRNWVERIILSHEIRPEIDAYSQIKKFHDAVEKRGIHFQRSLYLSDNLDEEEVSKAIEMVPTFGNILGTVFGDKPMIYASNRYSEQIKRSVLREEPYLSADWWMWDDDENLSVYAQSLRDFYNWEPTA